MTYFFSRRCQFIAKKKLDTVNNVLTERDETAKKNKKHTFGTEKKKIGEFFGSPQIPNKTSIS